MNIPCIYKKEPEKKSGAVKAVVIITAVVGAATLIYLAVKYFFDKYHSNCRALCHDDDDCDIDDCCDFEDCDCGCDTDDDCGCCGTSAADTDDADKDTDSDDSSDAE